MKYCPTPPKRLSKNRTPHSERLGQTKRNGATRPQATTNTKLVPTIKAEVLTAKLRLRVKIVVTAQQKAANRTSSAGKTLGAPLRSAATTTPVKPTIVAPQRARPGFSPSVAPASATTKSGAAK